jgi:hypothetical protein
MQAFSICHPGKAVRCRPGIAFAQTVETRRTGGADGRARQIACTHAISLSIIGEPPKRLRALNP